MRKSKNFEKISISNFLYFLEHPKEIKLNFFNLKALEKSYYFLLDSEKSSRLIYGYNTGFGVFGNKKIPNHKKEITQKKLIYHLSTGIGERFSNHESFSILLARIISLSKAYSGISLDSFKKLVFFFQKQVAPHIPQIGTVGASGDLTPLAHLVLSYLGESYVYYNNKTYKNKTFFQKYKIPTLELKGRDALAIVNGTSASCGISILNILELEKALKISTFYSFLYAEIFGLSLEYYSKYFYEVKQHKGFLKISEVLLKLLSSSNRINKKFLFEEKNKELMQPSYTLRAVIQVLGSVFDFIKHYYEIIETELNSVSDNPLFFVNDRKVVHGANFYGSHLSIVNDGIRVLIHQLANLSERRIAKINDPSLNLILPKFLVLGEIGTNSGFMGAQVTSTALLSEIRSFSFPCSIHSIPTNANNQDIVPLSCTSARLTRKSLELLFHLLAIEGLCLAQGMEILGIEQFSNPSKKFWNWVRKTSPFLKEDRSLSEEIQNLSKNLQLEKLEWNFEFSQD